MDETCQTTASRKMSPLSTMRPLARSQILQNGGQVYTPHWCSIHSGNMAYPSRSPQPWLLCEKQLLTEVETGGVWTGAGMTYGPRWVRGYKGYFHF